MKETYPLKVAGLTRHLPLCKLTDELYIGAFILFGDPELTVAAADALNKLAPQYDIAITAEAKGIPLLHEMARQMGNRPYLVARKSPKLYMKDLATVSVHSITTANVQQLYLAGAEMEMMRGKKVLLVDDVISTGESLHALEALVAQAGGEIVGRMAVLAEGDAIHRADITCLAPLPLFDKNGDPIAD